METAELDTALEELELRLERLRALYEQYFMGLEKIEPQIARKDVDRRIYVLRREKIRNTAKRFKLQTIIQRYNTFQQYWQRICREIENGTYKRHLLKAQKSGGLLTIAARKRLGRAGRTSQAPAAEPAAPSQPPATASAPPPVAEAPAPVAAAAPAPVVATPGIAPPLRRPPPPTRAPDVTAAAAPAPAGAPAPAAAVRPVPPAKPAPAKFESLDLDMDFMGDWDPGTSRGPSTAKPAAPPAKPAMPAAARPAPTRPAPPTPLTAALPKPPAAAPAARPASIPPAPVASPPRPASSRPPTAPARPPGALRTPLSPRIPAAPPKPAPKPAPAPAPLARPAVVPVAAAPKPAPAAAASVDDARLRDLHTRLQQAKLQTKEANVSYEGLAKSIRATEAKLREQHKNRKIDFDVVIKDGKAVVKPIVR